MISEVTKFVPDKSIDTDIVSDEDDNIEQTLNNPDTLLNNSDSETLICSHCHIAQPLTEFYVVTNYFHLKRGRTYRCKTCSRQSAKDSIAKKKAGKVKDETVLSS